MKKNKNYGKSSIAIIGLIGSIILLKVDPLWALLGLFTTVVIIGFKIIFSKEDQAE